MFKKGVGKDIRRVRVELLGLDSSYGIKRHEVELLELPKTIVRWDIEISLDEAILKSLDNMKQNGLVKAMVEFNSKALILSWKVDRLLQKELKEGGRKKWKRWSKNLPIPLMRRRRQLGGRRRKNWWPRRKRLSSWKVRCLDFDKKFKEKVKDLEADNEELKEKYQGIEVVELRDLKKCVVKEHINGFHKGLCDGDLTMSKDNIHLKNLEDL